jgi:hypothetical protein
MPGKQEGKPITQGLQPAQAREDYPFKDPAKRGKGRPLGSVNRYTGALKELFLQAADEVGDRTEIGPNGELDHSMSRPAANCSFQRPTTALASARSARHSRPNRRRYPCCRGALHGSMP